MAIIRRQKIHPASRKGPVGYCFSQKSPSAGAEIADGQIRMIRNNIKAPILGTWGRTMSHNARSTTRRNPTRGREMRYPASPTLQSFLCNEGKFRHKPAWRRDKTTAELGHAFTKCSGELRSCSKSNCALVSNQRSLRLRFEQRCPSKSIEKPE